MYDLLSLTPDRIPARPSPLDAVVAPAVQQEFLRGRSFPISFSPCSGMVKSSGLRRLKGTTGYEVLLEFLAHYVALVLPDPVATEGSFWAVETVIGSDVPVGEPQQLARVRVHGVAVATVVEDPDGDGQNPLVCLALAPAPVVGRVYSPESCYLDVGGAPVAAVHAEGPAGELSGLMASDPDLLAAARRAVVGLMRLGPAGGARHERHFADAVFNCIATMDGIARPRSSA